MYRCLKIYWVISLVVVDIWISSLQSELVDWHVNDLVWIVIRVRDEKTLYNPNICEFITMNVTRWLVRWLNFLIFIIYILTDIIISNMRDVWTNTKTEGFLVLVELQSLIQKKIYKIRGSNSCQTVNQSGVIYKLIVCLYV